MPTYEYVCRDCGRVFEVVRSMAQESLTICDECGGELRKVFAAPAISFKGSGFYATDHGKKGKKPSEKPGSEKPDKSEKKEPAASEKKPSGTKESPGKKEHSGSREHSGKKETTST
ncbi:MAG: hypothetical protein HY240_11010 [Actinobacteria bacterium]|nr:hypothetical protein [Actinomycetota bacterium]